MILAADKDWYVELEELVEGGWDSTNVMNLINYKGRLRDIVDPELTFESKRWLFIKWLVINGLMNDSC